MSRALLSAKRAAWWLVTWRQLGERPGHRKVAFNAQVTGSVKIGDYTYIGGRSEIRAVMSTIDIGRYCSIGRDVKIFSSGQAHRFDGLSTYPFFLIDPALDRKNFNPPGKDTVIGHDVWIGSNATIQAGVHIGNGAVVGSNAVVTTDVEPYTIVAGVPAKAIGRRYGTATAARVEATRWWEMDYEDLKATFPDLVVANVSLEGAGKWWDT